MSWLAPHGNYLRYSPIPIIVSDAHKAVHAVASDLRHWTGFDVAEDVNSAQTEHTMEVRIDGE